MLPGLICNLLDIFCFVNSLKNVLFRAYRVSGPQPQGGGRGQTCAKTSLGQVEMCLQNFIRNGERCIGLDFR